VGKKSLSGAVIQYWFKLKFLSVLVIPKAFCVMILQFKASRRRIL